jgi:hypothetical protein
MEATESFYSWVSPFEMLLSLTVNTSKKISIRYALIVSTYIFLSIK